MSTTIAGEPTGDATAGADGAFALALDAPQLPPGRYDVSADCGAVYHSPLDIVLATSVAPGGTALALLAFFVLFAGLLLRRRVF